MPNLHIDVQAIDNVNDWIESKHTFLWENSISIELPIKILKIKLSFKKNYYEEKKFTVKTSSQLKMRNTILEIMKKL